MSSSQEALIETTCETRGDSPSPASSRLHIEPASPARLPTDPANTRADVRMGRADAETGLIWTTTAFMALFHLGAIAALFFFSWTNLIVAAVLYIAAINLGIGMGRSEEHTS